MEATVQKRPEFSEDISRSASACERVHRAQAKSIHEARKQVADYEASLPDTPQEALSEISRLLSSRNDYYDDLPEGFESALAISEVVRELAVHSDDFEQARRYFLPIMERQRNDLAKVEQRLKRIGDILSKQARKAANASAE